MSDTGSEKEWEPKIVAYFCNWCSYTGSDLAGISRMSYEPNTRIIRVMCSGRIDPQFVVDAFRDGADGVLMGGCNPGDCHYQAGNYKTLRRFKMLKAMLKQFGIEDERLRLEWISAAHADKVQRVLNEMAEQLKKLGPLKLAEIPSPEQVEKPEPVAVGAEGVAQ